MTSSGCGQCLICTSEVIALNVKRVEGNDNLLKALRKERSVDLRTSKLTVFTKQVGKRWDSPPIVKPETSGDN